MFICITFQSSIMLTRGMFHPCLVQLRWYWKPCGHWKSHIQCLPTETGAGQKLLPSDSVAFCIWRNSTDTFMFRKCYEKYIREQKWGKTFSKSWVMWEMIINEMSQTLQFTTLYWKRSFSFFTNFIIEKQKKHICKLNTWWQRPGYLNLYVNLVYHMNSRPLSVTWGDSSKTTKQTKDKQTDSMTGNSSESLHIILWILKRNKPRNI